MPDFAILDLSQLRQDLTPELPSRPPIAATKYTSPTLEPFTSPANDQATPRIKPSLLSLPTELHHLVTPHLPYPDLLSLKLADSIFFHLIHPTKFDRIEWLLSRSALKLPIPYSAACSFRTDCEFVANAEIRRILVRRRNHVECAESLHLVDGKEECLVNEGKECAGTLQRAARKDRIWRQKEREGRTARGLVGRAMECDSGLWAGVAMVVLVPSVIAWTLK